MTKKLFFALFITVLDLSMDTTLANGDPHNSHPQTIISETCTAPAPSNFKVIARSTNFISLSWLPAWEGANHNLSVYQKNNLSEWDLLYNYYDIVKDSFTVGNLKPGKEYRFKLSTKCSNGDPSIFDAIIDDGALILELVLGGRIPIDPEEVGNCDNISLNHNWVGFKVDYYTDHLQMSNYFEYKSKATSTGPQWVTWLMRAYYDNPPIYVARKSDNIFPTINEAKIPAESPFSVIRFTGGAQMPELAGYVRLTEIPITSSIGLCEDPTQAWSQGYSFTPMVSESAIDPNGLPTDRNSFEKPDTEKPIIKNPFAETLCIIFPNAQINAECTVIQLYDINGRKVFEESYKNYYNQVSFSTANIVSGVYILNIKSPTKNYVFQVIKSGY